MEPQGVSCEKRTTDLLAYPLARVIEPLPWWSTSAPDRLAFDPLLLSPNLVGQKRFCSHLQMRSQHAPRTPISPTRWSMKGWWVHCRRLTSMSTLRCLLELCVAKVRRLKSCHSKNENGDALAVAIAAAVLVSLAKKFAVAESRVVLLRFAAGLVRLITH